MRGKREVKMAVQPKQQKSQVDNRWLTEEPNPTDLTPECKNGHGTMWWADSKKVGGTPGTDTFLELYECPECGYRTEVTDRP